jgi:hypothetical protein
MRNLFVALLALVAVVPAIASNDAQMVTPNTIATETPKGVNFTARFTVSSGGGGSVPQYAVSSESPSGWITHIGTAVDGGSWSSSVSINYNTSLGSGHSVACSATALDSGAANAFGVPVLSQPFTSSGTFAVQISWSGGESFFPENGFDLICVQTS